MFREMSLNKRLTKGVTTVGLATALSLGMPSAYGQTAGSKTVGASQQEMKQLEKGWSAKKDIIGKAV